MLSRVQVLTLNPHARLDFYSDYFGVGSRGYYVKAGRWGVPISPVCPKPAQAWEEALNHLRGTDAVQKTLTERR